MDRIVLRRNILDRHSSRARFTIFNAFRGRVMGHHPSSLVYFNGEVHMSDPLPDFQDLLRRLRERDEQAAKELVRHYGNEIRIVVKHRLKHHAAQLQRICDADDLTQDAWKSIFRFINEGHPFETDAELFALLMQIARNKVDKAARRNLYTAKRDLRRQEALDDRAASLVDPTLDPAATFENKESLRRALLLLLDEDRAILRMRYQDKCSHREMAEKLGWTERAVARKMVQILETLAPGVPRS